MVKIDSAQRQHYAKKQLKLDEDPWDNYLFYDSKGLIPLICHPNPLNIYEQVILAKFIQYTIETETISQYKIQSKEIIRELLKFASEFGQETQESIEEDDIVRSDDEEEDSLTQANSNKLETRIRLALANDNISEAEQEALNSDMARMLKMFYLDMRVKGMLTEYKNDYFM